MIPHRVPKKFVTIVCRLSQASRFLARYGRPTRSGADVARHPWHGARGAAIARLRPFGRHHRFVVVALPAVAMHPDTAGQANALTPSHVTPSIVATGYRRSADRRASWCASEPSQHRGPQCVPQHARHAWQSGLVPAERIRAAHSSVTRPLGHCARPCRVHCPILPIVPSPSDRTR